MSDESIVFMFIFGCVTILSLVAMYIMCKMETRD